ncbi:MAG: hypothetical protein M1815_003744 [Lichina confinis]|nr:MAG: hypothetical protein M1815_003744 [Lichina confinis]
MPRVANPPRASARVISNDSSAASPFKSPVKMPLNDDAQEKAARLHSRQALHDLQLNQLKAAASPMRKLSGYNRAASSSPQSLSGRARRTARQQDPDGGLEVLGSSVVSPVKRVPILANFEEWMKLATDNKINATNSWNFALIDYFHDMSLLKEGDGVNFQKASCTLDGCVKIYTSRVDSVATETGKLLSGLTDNGSKKRRGDADGDDEGQGGEGEEDGEDEVEDENGVRKRVKKRAQRSTGATLATSFAQLQLKKFDLEFSVDPLFKKAAADFDEGGARGLLLNSLAIDSEGRIIFDSSDEADKKSLEAKDGGTVSGPEPVDDSTNGPSGADEMDADPKPATDIDIPSLQARFFPDLDLLDSQDICPSLKNLDFGDGNADLDIPFLKARQDDQPEMAQAANLDEKSGILLDDGMAAGFDDDDDDEGLGGFDLPPDTGFGEGGEAWAKDAALEPHMAGVQRDAEGDELGRTGEDGGELQIGEYDGQNTDYVLSLSRDRANGGAHDDILSYFDDALRKNWAGPEHWRIRKIKDLTKAAAPAPKVRKEKEPFEIDFLAPLDAKVAAMIYTPATSGSAIALPKTQWKSKTRNLLPDDKHFSSRQLVQLFLKPKARLRTRRRAAGPHNGQARTGAENQEELMDEGYWARDAAAKSEGDVQGNYDANFFQDDGLVFPGGLPDDDDDDFVDARDNFRDADGKEGVGGGADPPGSSGPDGGYGNQLVTQGRRLRPEYVQYARVAKKVDVRRLKEEMWKGMGLEVDPPPASARQSLDPESTPSPEEPPMPKPTDPLTATPLKFTTVINNLQFVYPEPAMADISTSYCFICLLHLANEKGLEIVSDERLTELDIRKDPTAEISADGF